jgi:hypothetical protein
MHVLIAGGGDIGTALGVEPAAMAHDVWGIRRTSGGLPSAVRGPAAPPRGRPDDPDGNVEG